MDTINSLELVNYNKAYRMKIFINMIIMAKIQNIYNKGKIL